MPIMWHCLFFSLSSNSLGRSFYHSLSVLPEARFRRDLDTSGVEMFFLLLLFVWGSFLWPIEASFEEKVRSKEFSFLKWKRSVIYLKIMNNLLELLTATILFKS